MPPSGPASKATMAQNTVLAFVAFVAFVVMPFGGTVLLVLDLPPAIAAAQGHGTRGTFIAKKKVCGRSSCTWMGDFASDDGRIELHNLDGGGSAHAAGDRIRVFQDGGQLFRPGTKEWIEYLLLGLVGWGFGGVGIGLLWRNRRKLLQKVTRRASKNLPSF